MSRDQTILVVLAGLVVTAALTAAFSGDGAADAYPMRQTTTRADVAPTRSDAATLTAVDVPHLAEVGPFAAPGGGGGPTASDGELEFRDLAAGTEQRSELRGYGSMFALELVGRPLAEALASTDAPFELTLRSTSDRNTIEHVIAGTAALGFVATKLSSNDLRDGVCEVELGHSVAALVVHADNPFHALSSPQIRELLTGQAPSWTRLGWEPNEVRVLYPTAHWLKQPLTGILTPGDPLARSRGGDSFEDVVRRVAKDPFAIGITDLASLEDLQQTHDTRAMVVSVDGVRPDLHNYLTGMYPYGRTVRLVYRDWQNPDVRRALEFVRGSTGRQVVAARLTGR